jgi:diguanylate cyclase (GGDEF)-like protein
MTGGVAFRNFSAPRLVMVMIMLSLGPCAIAGVMSGEQTMLATALQIPMYIYAMTHAAYRLNAMLVQTMRSERENGRRARQDTLTGLLNRAGLEDVVARRADDTKRGATLFYIDLDGFKAINDTLGHAAGDQLLVEVSQLMRQVTPAMDVVARIGGDEFIILADQMDPATAHQNAQRFINTLSGTSFLLDGTVVAVSASIGISIKSGALSDLSVLMLEADRALYNAKLMGRSRALLASIS